MSKVPGGHITYSEVFNTNGPFNSGTFATLMCEFGRTLIGPASVTCRNGSWDPIGVCQNPAELHPTSGGGSFLAPSRLNPPPPTARCLPIKSPSLKSTLEFDQTPLADGNYPNSTIAHLICLEDNASIINGVSEAECIKGIWLPKLGECSFNENGNKNTNEEESDIEREEKTHLSGPGHCQPIEPPSKGKISYIQSGAKNTYQVGSTAILNCDIGYSVSGHAALSCAPGGTWLPANGFGKCLSNTDLVH
uniref:Sushi domain-containing protein n=1 Tax=Panagrolaimus superbus TaxID=310955 RepID=A0A914Y0B9_9BILA